MPHFLCSSPLAKLGNPLHGDPRQQPLLEIKPGDLQLLRQEYARALSACADCLQGMQQGCYAFEQGAQGGLVAEGRITKPVRYATTVEGPLRLSGQISRTRQCADHHIVLSSSSTPPSQPGAAHLQSYHEHVLQAVITHTNYLVGQSITLKCMRFCLVMLLCHACIISSLHIIFS